jgi:hypothetical protein
MRYQLIFEEQMIENVSTFFNVLFDTGRMSHAKPKTLMIRSFLIFSALSHGKMLV